MDLRDPRKQLGYNEQKQFKDHHNEARIFTRRLVLSAIFVMCSFSLLLTRFYSLQIVHYDNYATLSDRNRIQVRPIPPNRGLVYDQNGELLADNRPTMTLTIVKERAGNLEETIHKISQIISLSDRDIERFYKALELRRRPFESVPLRFRLTESELARIAVNEFDLYGVKVEGQLVRYYPYSDLYAHALGYVGRINERELTSFTPELVTRYSGTQSIGKIGLERSYELDLLGQPGQENIETNARGRVLRVIDSVDPIAGKDLELFLRTDVQQAAYDALGERRGAVVALEVKTGGVTALVSNPSYDPNLFVTGISTKDYLALNTSKDLPLFNRSIQGQYPPGSTVKPILGLGGLKKGFVTPHSSVPDPGFYKLKNDDRLYREWKKGGHGAHISLKQAIVESCDIYFYDLGFRMGVDQMHEFGVLFGLGQRTQIDIPSERPGLWPSREWKRNTRGLAWYPGNSLNMSIGQGDVLTTPLQLAVMTTTFARRGSFVEPRIVKAIDGLATQQVIRKETVFDEMHWNFVKQSMKDSVHSTRGTAISVGKHLSFDIAGKTGTAQVVSIAQDSEYDSESLRERNRDHALFIAFAPVDEPEIAVAVILENGEKSSKAAAVAVRVIQQYLYPDMVLSDELLEMPKDDLPRKPKENAITKLMGHEY